MELAAVRAEIEHLVTGFLQAFLKLCNGRPYRWALMGGGIVEWGIRGAHALSSGMAGLIRTSPGPQNGPQAH